MQNLKTGCLIAFSCESGAILAKRPAEDRLNLRHFGFLLGLAYQIQDDILDIEGSQSSLGKPIGMDANKRSLVALLGVKESKKYLLELQEEMFQLIHPYNQPIFNDLITWTARRKA
jgi:farnesyl diphosphate synthase